MPKDEARNRAIHYLKRCNLEHIALSKNAALTEKERFCAMILRAAMVKDAIVIITRPFQLLSSNRDSSYMYHILKNVDDLYTECYILDYVWNKYRYGKIDAT